MTCSVYMGNHIAGEKSRRAGFFQDGNLIQRVEIIARQIVVTDPVNREYYRSEPLAALENYSVQQIGAVRSAQTGKLVICLGGFYAGDDGMQSLIVATDYSVRQPVEYQG